MGAIMYECLVGYPPFCSDSPHATYRKILNWRDHLFIPQDVHLSREAQDLISRLICQVNDRLNIGRIKAHPFFRGVDFQTLRKSRAPFIPKLTSITDTSYFPTEELAQVPETVPMDTYEGESGNSKDLAFIGYTYKRWDTVRNEL
jgi:serine/threonine protein kinase